MISIIIPVYNVEKYLDECIQSVISQSCSDFECILVDDGSTDGSLAICRQYEAADPRVRVLTQPNSGVSTARNAGLDAARGEYIAFIDSDDVAAPDYLENAAALLNAHPGYLAAMSELCPGDPYWPDGHILRDEALPLNSDRERFRCILRHYLPCNVGYDLHGKLYDRQLLETNGLRFHPGIRLGEDLAFNLEYLLYARGVVSSSKVAYTYFDRQGSLSSSVKTSLVLAEYDRFLEEVSAVLPDARWQRRFPVIYMRAMDIQFRQKPAREMIHLLSPLRRRPLWRRMVGQVPGCLPAFWAGLGFRDGTKLWLKACLYGAKTR